MNSYLNDSIFWIEVEKIVSNPYQPRKEFNQDALNDLADSIRQYGILQPLVVTRKEEEKEDGGLRVYYELIAGERRLRASKIAGISQVPTVIRSAPEDPKEKLEIAIIENLQREDLNPVDRARAFARLVEEFGFKHSEVAKKVGRSREYVSNSLRLLDLPEEVQEGLKTRKVTEGHARTLGMLKQHPDEQKVLYKEIVYKHLSVRESERIARSIAKDRVRKKEHKPDPELNELEGKLSNTLGTRVHIERKENGGKLVIDFFSNNDLEDILKLMDSNKAQGANAFMDRFIASQERKSQAKDESHPVPGGNGGAANEEGSNTTEKSPGERSESHETVQGEPAYSVEGQLSHNNEQANDEDGHESASLTAEEITYNGNSSDDVENAHGRDENSEERGGRSEDAPTDDDVIAPESAVSDHEESQVHGSTGTPGETSVPAFGSENTNEVPFDASVISHESTPEPSSGTEIDHSEMQGDNGDFAEEKRQEGESAPRDADTSYDLPHVSEGASVEGQSRPLSEQGAETLVEDSQENHIPEERWEPKPPEEKTDDDLYSVKNFTI